MLFDVVLQDAMGTRSLRGLAWVLLGVFDPVLRHAMGARSLRGPGGVLVGAPAPPRRYTRPMSSTGGEGSAPAWTVGVATGIAVVVLWRYRNVLPPDVLSGLALPWIWLVVWTVASFGAGRILMPAAAEDLERGAGLVGTLALGSALLALAGALMAWAGWLHSPVVIAVLAAAALLGAVRLHRERSVVGGLLRKMPPPALGAVGLAALVVTMTLPAPPVMYDTLNYHLAFPARWLRAGGFVEFPRHAFSYYPAAGGMAYAYALAVLGPWAAKALHLWAGLLAAGAAGCLGARLGGRAAGGWAAVVFFLTPSVLQSSTFATADLWVAAWGGAALLLLVGSRDGAPRPVRRFGWAGFLAGSAAAAKILGLATVVLPLGLVALFLVWLGGPPRGGRWLPLAAFASSVVLPLAPWLVRNLLWTGNPLYPYLRSLLGGPPAGFSIAGELAQNGPAAAGLGARILHVVSALGTRTFHPLQAAANIGPLWLILLPVAALLPAVRKNRAFTPLAVAVVSGLLAWGSLVQFGRFLLPVLVAGGALAGATVVEISRGRIVPVASRALVALVVGVLCWNATAVFDPLSVERLQVTTGILPGEALLERWAGYWPAARFIDASLPRQAKVLMVSEARSLYVDRDVVVEDPYRVPLLAELAAASRDRYELGKRLRDMGVTHLLVNEREMARLASLRGVPDYWTGVGPRGRQVLADFLVHGVRRVFQLPGLWVAELGAPSGGRPPGNRVPPPPERDGGQR